jgi:probable rRNA maturation factor
LNLETECAIDFPFNHHQVAKDVIHAALIAEKFPYHAEVNLLLVSTERIKEINQTYRQVDHVTDVLSFPMLTYEYPGDFTQLSDSAGLLDASLVNPENGAIFLGDIVLCIAKVNEQALAYGHSSQREYAFLILHSMLHLFGYDHMTKEDAARMQERQNNILKRLDIMR